MSDTDREYAASLGAELRLMRTQFSSRFTSAPGHWRPFPQPDVCIVRAIAKCRCVTFGGALPVVRHTQR